MRAGEGTIATCEGTIRAGQDNATWSFNWFWITNVISKWT